MLRMIAPLVEGGARATEPDEPRRIPASVRVDGANVGLVRAVNNNLMRLITFNGLFRF